MARESKKPRERYATVARRMWNDEVFRSWSSAPANAQTLWQFLLTTPEATNVPGVFRFSTAATAERFGWTQEDTRRCLDEIITSGRAEYDPIAQLIYLPNALRWNEPESPNVVRSWWRHWSELPECTLKRRAGQCFKRYLAGVGQVFSDEMQACISGMRGKSSPDPSPKVLGILPRRVRGRNGGSFPDPGSGSGSGSDLPLTPPQGGSPSGSETETEIPPPTPNPDLAERTQQRLADLRRGKPRF